ncbi:MAG TPA: VTT domain-containing protein [Candidatus Binatia bacterium]|nr:VTT domain-containing protein [Candidatus Binatia bacterium]
MIRLLLSFIAATRFWTWLHRLGGPGLIVLGVIDNSAIPVPGSMDVFVILLSAHHRQWWPYYAFMAVVGAVVGGYLTYRLAEKGGEETVEKKVGKERAEKVYRRFKKRGFATIVIGAILPPPFPIVPFLLAAGALQYPRKNFIAALGTGRAIRFFGLAYLAHLYGKAIVSWGARYYQSILYALIALAVLGGIAALLYFKWYRPGRQREERQEGKKVEDFPVPFRHEQKRRRAR